MTTRRNGVGEGAGIAIFGFCILVLPVGKAYYKDMLVFIDESGQFTKSRDGEYFVVGSFTVGDPRRTEKRFRSWQRDKFPKKMRNQAEIKFSDKIDEKLRVRTLEQIARSDVRIRYSFLKRSQIHSDFRDDRKIKSGLLYTHIIGITLESYLPITDSEFRVFCDQRHLKGIKRSEFKDILRAQISPQLPANCIIEIEMLDSTTNANIQIADWITGALAHYIEGKPNGEKYYQIIKNNIIGDGIELFKDNS